MIGAPSSPFIWVRMGPYVPANTSTVSLGLCRVNAVVQVAERTRHAAITATTAAAFTQISAAWAGSA